MLIRNSKSWVNHSLKRSAVLSLLVLSVAFATRMLLHPYIEPYAPYHGFIVACLCIAYFFGYKLALCGVMISAMVGSYFFVRPYYQFGPLSATDLTQFITFSSVTLVAIFAIERLQRTAYSRTMVVKIMESRHKISLMRENDRLYFAKQQNQSWAILESILTNFEEVMLLKFGSANLRVEPLFLELAHSPKHLLTSDEWLTLLHPDDAAQLQAALHADLATKPQHLSLRFSHDPQQTAHAVTVETNRFMNQSLKVVRLRKKVVDV
jgi:K+-sensing histidine kinase KdpD